MKKESFEVEFPERGGYSITVRDKERDLCIVLTYPEPIDLDTNSDFYMNDVARQMNEITYRYDNITIDSILNDNEIE
jgi:hypothetical protein